MLEYIYSPIYAKRAETHPQISITRNSLQEIPEAAPTPPTRRLRARTRGAALVATRIRARAAVALVTASVPLGAPHMR